MTTPLSLHYAYFEAESLNKRRMRPLGLSCGNGWYAKKNQQTGCWEMGRYEKWGSHPGGRYQRLPQGQWIFDPHYIFAPNQIRWNPNRAQNQHLRAWTTSQRGKATSSTIYKFGHDPWKPIVTIQGEGDLVLDHTLDGRPIRLQTSKLPFKKVWDKAKYLELRRKRVKAERILRGICKMGGFETEKYSFGNVDAQQYLNLLDQLVNDENPKSDAMEEMARLVQGRIMQLTRYQSAYTTGQGWTRIAKTPSADDAFASLRDELRQESYKLTKTYTYEPFDDGRHTARFDP